MRNCRRVQEIVLYEKMDNGDGVSLRRGRDILKFACCDCGMVHFIKVQLTKKEKYFWVRFWRDDRATGQLRRHKYGDLQHALKGYRIVKGKK